MSVLQNTENIYLQSDSHPPLFATLIPVFLSRKPGNFYTQPSTHTYMSAKKKLSRRFHEQAKDTLLSKTIVACKIL